MAYNFLLSFARDNELQVRPGRGDKREDGENGDGGGGGSSGEDSKAAT